MPGTKDELRAEIASLREELAAERAKAELLQAQAATHHCHGCGCVHMTWTYPCVAPYVAPYVLPGTVWTSQPYTITCGDPAPSTAGGISTTTLGYVQTTCSSAAVLS